MTHRQLYNLYIASGDMDGGIYQYEMNEKGDLQYIEKYALGKTVYMAIKNDKLYALLNTSYEEDSGLVSFAIDDNGYLREQSGIASTKGKIACHLAVDSDNVYCVNYISGSVIKMPDKLVTHTGNGAHPTRQASPHTHYVCVTPDEKYLCVTDLGIDKIIVYDKDMNFISQTSVPSGHGARHLIFSQDGNTLFCANELASTVSVLSYQDGELVLLDTCSALPEDFKGESYAAAIRLSSYGKYLFVSNRGHDSICCFQIEGNQLSLQGFTDCGGLCPRDFYIIDDLLICTNEHSDNVTLFKIDGSKLTKMDSEIKIPVPLSVIAVKKTRNIGAFREGGNERCMIYQAKQP